MRTDKSSIKLDEEAQLASADRMLNFLSRIKYLYYERETSENTGISIPNNFTFTDQRSIIKAQAERIRNQLDLKFSSIDFLFQADKLGGGTASDSAFAYYNPLQIIRDRGKRPKASKYHSRENLWQITISEQVEDTRRRFCTARLRVQKQKKKLRRNSSFAKDTADRDVRLSEIHSPRTHSSNATPPRSSSKTLLNGSLHLDPAWPRSAPSNSEFTFLTPGSVTSINRVADGPTSNLPQSDCTELIARLRSSHSGTSQMDGSSTESILDDEVDKPQSEDAEVHDDKGPEGEFSEEYNFRSRSRFCRNSASVADTWKRLYRSRADRSRYEDSRLKPISRISTHSSNFSQSGLSLASSAVISGSDDGLCNTIEGPVPSVPQSHRTFSNGDVHPVFGGSLKKRGSVDSSTDPLPFLKPISASGQEKFPDNPKISSKFSARIPSSGEIAEAPRVEHFLEPGQGFGSLRPPSTEARKDSHERALCTLLSDLRYLIPYYSIILRRDEAGLVYQPYKARMTPLMDESCAQLSDSLKSDMVAKLLPFLGKIEQTVVSEQQLLDAEVATCLNELRVSTDLMVGDVNTTMNRRIREISSRMERMSNCKSHGMCLAFLYSLLEYGVVFIMWLIWLVVQLAKPLKWLFVFVRAICSSIIIT